MLFLLPSQRAIARDKLQPKSRLAASRYHPWGPTRARILKAAHNTLPQKQCAPTRAYPAVRKRHQGAPGSGTTKR